MMELISSKEAAGTAGFSDLLVRGGTLSLLIEFSLYWAFDVFTEFSAPILNKTFRHHVSSEGLLFTQS
jgi:hypothetical protein